MLETVDPVESRRLWGHVVVESTESTAESLRRDFYPGGLYKLPSKIETGESGGARSEVATRTRKSIK